MKRIMKLLFLLAVLAALLAAFGCTPRGPVSNVQGTGDTDVRYIEIRIENHNWNLARVYVRAAYSNMRYRLATVATNGRKVIHWRPAFPEFVLHVTFLAARDTWASQRWSDREDCLKLVIANVLVHSYVVPCYLEEESL